MKKSIYIGPRMLALIERVPADQRNTSRIVNSACDRYAAIVAAHLPVMSPDEWGALADALRDLPPDPFSPGMVRSLCADHSFRLGDVAHTWSVANIAAALDYLEMTKVEAS